jgi:penicillin-binding protein 1A
MNLLNSLLSRLKLTPFLPKRPWQLVLFTATGLFVMGILLAATIALILTPTLPSLDDLSGDRLKVPLRVYSAEGTLIAEFGEERRIPVTTREVPPQLIQAILAAEDDAFYVHQGVDFQGILRAAINNLRRGGTHEGASTITMQVARNYFLSPEKTYSRKIKEILLAFKIEREFNKDKILELYLNKIFLGSRAYGFAAAGQIYFGKALGDLTLPEMALLAGLPKAPSRYNPMVNPDSALERRGYVLRRMLKLGYINEATFTEAMNAPIGASRHALQFSLDAPYVAEMVRQYVVGKYSESSYAEGYNVYTTIRAKDQQAAQVALRKALIDYDRRHGWRGPAGHENINRKTEAAQLDELLKDYPVVGGLLPALIVHTDEKLAIAYTQDGTRAELDLPTMSWALRYIDEDTLGPPPKKATDLLHVGDVVYLQRAEADGEVRWKLVQLPDVEGGFVSINPNDGAILALAGGFDFFRNQYNHVTLAQRQPGSGFKPFIYSAALDKDFTPASLISGAPIVIEDVSLEDEWRPEDYSRKFFGPTRLRKALALSLNLVAVRLLRAITPEYAAEYMGRFGFDPARLPKNLSLTLGTAEATPLQMASAFSVFANGGYRIEPYLITRIEDAKHNILEQASPVIVCPDCPPPPKSVDPAAPAPRYAEQAITRQNSFLMNSILRDTVSYGTAQAANVLNRKDLAGKTGTTNDHRDAWFNGFNSDLVGIAWVGFDQNESLGKGETGGRAALPMWIEYMRVVLDGVPEKPLVPPPGIVTATINRETGKLTTAADPEAMQEYFLEGTVDTGADVVEGGTPGDTTKSPDNVREGLF